MMVGKKVIQILFQSQKKMFYKIYYKLSFYNINFQQSSTTPITEQAILEPAFPVVALPLSKSL